MNNLNRSMNTVHYQMKILWLAHRDPMHPKAGGAERTIMELCSRFSEMGYGVTVLSARWQGSGKIEKLHGFTIQRFGGNVLLHFYAPLYIMKKKPDLVINDLGHAVPWPSSTLLRKKMLVFFRHLHARSLPGQVNQILASFITGVEKLYFLIYPNTIFITESTTSVADLSRLGMDKKNIIQIQPGVDLNLYLQSDKTSEPSIIYFGGMRKYKRPEEAIHIFHDVFATTPSLKLTVVGTGPELKSLKDLVKTYRLDKNVTFTGRVPDEVLPSIISRSWLNIHTSITEGWGYSILEASAAGTPTVAYSVPGVVDAIEDGKNGLKVEDGNRGAFVDAVLKILGDPKPWWNSSHTVAEKYSWDESARNWNEIMKRVFHKEANNRQEEKR